jgi:hypothetical protein
VTTPVSNYFQHEGRTYLNVKPVEQLMRSNLISDVIKRGDRLAVDLDSGKLTIVASVEKIEAKVKIEYVVVSPNGTRKRFSTYGQMYSAITKHVAASHKTFTVIQEIGGREEVSMSYVGGSFPGFIERLARVLDMTVSQ